MSIRYFARRSCSLRSHYVPLVGFGVTRSGAVQEEEVIIDSTYIASLLDQFPDPVLAVGHSYGGAVITNAVTNANNVIGLVYVAAFAPDEGVTLADIASNRQTASSTRP